MGNRPRQSLAEADSVVASEWHPTLNGLLSPHDVLSGSGKAVWWLCKESHPYEQSPYNRTNSKKRLGCPYCGMQRLLVGFNDFETRFPELALEWDFESNSPLTPSQVMVSAKATYSWICQVGHTWEATTKSRAMGRGCHVCSNYQVVSGVNDLETLHPHLAREFLPELNGGLHPSQIGAGDNRNYIWKCEKGHEYPANVNNRVRGRTCGVCANRLLVSGVNDLATTHPHLLREWDYLENTVSPASIFGGHQHKIFWICAYGHKWQASPSSRISGRGCRTCANQELLVGFNDFATRYPLIAKEWDSDKNGVLMPSQFFPNSNEQVFWNCPLGHSYKSRIAVRVAGSGCQTCAKSGFDPSQAGLVYFLEHETLVSFKVGITNVSTRASRVRQFKNRGWTTHLIHQFQSGQDALRAESEFFLWLRGELGIPNSLQREDMGGMAGHTETFSSIAISKEEVIQKLEQLGCVSPSPHFGSHQRS